MDLPSLGVSSALVIPKKDGKILKGDSRYLRVVHADQLYDTIYQIHAHEFKHAGYKKVLDYAQRYYNGVTRTYVQEFCKTCPVCQLTQP